MKNVKLYNSVEVPVLGIGTFMISPDDTERSVYSALKTGYRMIDTANAYMNEEAVGKGLKKAIAEGIVSREEVFVSTKIWATLYNNGNGSYWFKVSRGFSTALMESHSSLETLIEEKVEFTKEEEAAINKALALVNGLYK